MNADILDGAAMKSSGRVSARDSQAFNFRAGSSAKAAAAPAVWGHHWQDLDMMVSVMFYSASYSVEVRSRVACTDV